jgi:hypothetical protein
MSVERQLQVLARAREAEADPSRLEDLEAEFGPYDWEREGDFE